MPRRPFPRGPGICNSCGKPSGKFKTCEDCRQRNKAAQDKFYGRVTSPKICAQEGCTTVVEFRRTYCVACNRFRKVARNKSRGKSPDDVPTVKPHRPAPVAPHKPLISDKEQARLDAEASARDRAWNAKFFKQTMGLESAPGQPLASKVVTPPQEVWEQYQKQWKPQRELESGSMVLPYLQRDMTF